MSELYEMLTRNLCCLNSRALMGWYAILPKYKCALCEDEYINDDINVSFNKRVVMVYEDLVYVYYV